MSLRFLLDTNVLSEPIKPAPNQSVLDRIREHSGEVATASVGWHELLFGVTGLPRGRRRHEAERFLEQVVARTIPVLPYDAEAASWHANERARLRALGRQLDLADGQIAAVAVLNDLTLVTANVRDFAHIRGLRVVDWSR